MVVFVVTLGGNIDANNSGFWWPFSGLGFQTAKGDSIWVVYGPQNLNHIFMVVFMVTLGSNIDANNSGFE